MYKIINMAGDNEDYMIYLIPCHNNHCMRILIHDVYTLYSTIC